MEVYHYIFGFTIFLVGITLSQSDKPSGLSQGVYCEGCIATVQELLKKVNKNTGESREVKVIEAMEDICNLQNFGSYEYSPPKTGQACKFIMENYDEEIENTLVGESGDFEQKICYKLTEACKGVDRTKKEKEELEVKINDEKQKLQSGSAKKDPEPYHVNINEEGAAAKLVDQINMAIKNKKNSGGDDDGGDDDGDDGDDDGDDGDDDGEKDDGDKEDGDKEDDGDNEIGDDSDMDDVNAEDIENLTDQFKKDKTEL